MIRSFLSSIIFVCLYSEATAGTLTGTVTDQKSNPIPGTTILLKYTSLGAITDENGNYTISNVPEGDYILIVSSVGFENATRKISITSDQTLNIDFALIESMQELNEVVVMGKSESRMLSEEPIAVNSLGTKPLLGQAMGAEELLKTTTGVVVRQNGGLGSKVNINLNGLSGQAVRIYFDGIPFNVFGGGFQLNTIPIDALERVDVYKGVMPITVGTDALGGGINLIPARKEFDYLHTSYTIGSFNTHRFSFSGNKQIREHISFSILSYFNYSDNDYKMRDIENINEETGQPEFIDVHRFHNRHISTYIEGAIKINDTRWTDRLELATSYAFRDDEIQHGAFITPTAVGELTTRFGTFMQRLDYTKKLWGDRLELRYYGTASFTKSLVNDSSRFIYDWRGGKLQTVNASGSELFAVPIRRNGEDFGHAHRFLASFKINSQVEFAISDFYRFSKIQGEDPVGPRLTISGESVDPNTIPATISRNIFGAEFRGKFLQNKLTPVVFFKNYWFDAESIDILQTSASRLPLRKVQSTENGYGIAVKYELTSSLFIRSSYEQTIRIPTETEIFGDFAAALPNYELRPESSDNLNVGIQFSRFLPDTREFFLRVDLFKRDQKDLIRPEPFGPDNIVYINEAEVDGKGVEMATRYNPIKNVKLSGNFTLQSNEIVSSGNEVPNRPLIFYNLEGRYIFQDKASEDSSLEIFWNYFYTGKFSINEVPDLKKANPKSVVPTQQIHNTGMIYHPVNSDFSFSLNIQNIFNAEVFDNFGIPRPGINYNIKINYSI